MPDKKASKIKWCSFLAPYPLLMEFLGKFFRQVLKEGDDCILISNSKIAEYSKPKYFPENIEIFSKVDWCIKNYKEEQKEFENLSWKDIFTRFSRNKLLKFSYQDLIKSISQIYQFVDFVFQKERPDVVIYGMPGSLYAQVAYLLCKKYNITYLGLVSSRFPGRMDVCDLKYNCSKYRKTFKELSDNSISNEEKKFANNFIRNFITHKQLSSYADYQNTYSKKLSLKNYLKKELEMARYWFKYFLKRRYFKKFDYESESQFKNWLYYPIKELKWRFKFIPRKSIFDSLNENDKFFLFPLHVQPELSTSALATYFYNQLNTITNIAFSLPFPYKLYVKEHPFAFEGREKSFYQELKRIPNVVLISPKEDNEFLIKKSQGVIILTSTMGMEAILAGKPAYALGDVFYDYHPLCRRVDSFEELRQKIKKDLEEKPFIDDLENVNVRFILSYFKNTIPGDVFSAVLEPDINNYKLIYQSIEKTFLNQKINIKF